MVAETSRDRTHCADVQATLRCTGLIRIRFPRPACHKSYCACARSHVSALPPSHCAKRIAMSALIAARPLMTLDSATLDTPSWVAAAVTVRPRSGSMIPLNSASTQVALGASSALQSARGNVVTDVDGLRRATLIFPAGTVAQLVMPAPPANAPYTTLYDADSRITSVTLPDGKTETFSFDSGNRPTSVGADVQQCGQAQPESGNHRRHAAYLPI